MFEPLIQDTLILIKPDAMARRLLGRILARLEDKELDIVALKMITLDTAGAQDLYLPHQGKYFYPRLLRFITCGPLTAMVCRGRQAIARVRQIIGEASPELATPGTIRGDFTCHQTYNLIHASDSPGSARREIPLFFTAQEFHIPQTPPFTWHSFPELTEP
jgi:nucleoside-diphosphate kinase